MNVEVPMPQLGETVAEGTITRWLRRVGDVVADQEPLLEISTDKVDTEVPAPSGGTLLEIRVGEDETVSVGTVLAVIGAVVPEPAASEVPAPAPAAAVTATPAGRRDPESGSARHRAPRHAHSPRVRRLAAEAGLSLANVRGSGPGGRVTPGDVAAAAAPERGPDGSSPALSTGRPTAVVEVDVTPVLDLLVDADRSLHQRAGGRLTLTPFVAKAALEALTTSPSLNSARGDDARPAAHHLSITVDTDDGARTGVVRDANDLSLLGLSRRMADLAAGTSQGAAGSDVPAAGTFTIADRSRRGVLFHAAVLDPGQAGALGIGAVVERPAVVRLGDGERGIAIRSTVHLALTYDHLLVPAAEADRFLGAIKDRLQSGRFEPELV